MQHMVLCSLRPISDGQTYQCNGLLWLLQVLYEQYKRCFSGEYFGTHVRQLSTAETIGIGALAGASASFISTPADVVKSRLMTTAAGSSISTRQIVVDLIQKEGFMALFKGALFRAVWIAPLGAMNFAGYELAKRAMGVSQPTTADAEQQRDVSLQPAEAVSTDAGSPGHTQVHTTGVVAVDGSELHSAKDGGAQAQATGAVAGDGVQCDTGVQVVSPPKHPDSSKELARITWQLPWEQRSSGVSDTSGSPPPHAVCKHCCSSRSGTV